MNKPLHIVTERPADFQQLVGLIKSTSTFLQEHARNVINRDVTVRAWLTGVVRRKTADTVRCFGFCQHTRVANSADSVRYFS